MSSIRLRTRTVTQLNIGVPVPGVRACNLAALRALVAHVEGLPDETSVYLRTEDGRTAAVSTIEVST